MEVPEIAQRIKVAKEYLGLTSSAIAHRAGLTESNFNKQLRGAQTITDRTLTKISNAFNLSFTWLKYGEGEMLQPVDTLPVVDSPDGVPYYDIDFLAGFDEFIPPSSENPDRRVLVPGYERATLWCNVTGDSMAPEIVSGSAIALRLIEDPSFLLLGDIYAIITTNGLRTIKRLGRGSSPDTYTLLPTNPAYDPQEIPRSRILRVFQVLGTIRRL